jgi:hypothetical protein
MPPQSREEQRAAQRQPDIDPIAPDDTCNARKRNGEGYCGRPAGWGTDHLGVGRCKMHGGNMPNHRKQAQTELAKLGVEAFGLPINIDPHDALMEELHRTAGIIAFYELQIQSLQEVSDLHGPTGTSGSDIESGLEHHPSEAPNIWVKLHKEERQHFVKVAESCIKAGIDERRVQIAEQQGVLIATAIRNILMALGIDTAQAQVREVIREHLSVITSTATEIPAKVPA